jgi:phosphoribosylaminoimidazole carboxylase PurE protein
MRHTASLLDKFNIIYEKKIVEESAHRTPVLLFNYANLASGRGLKILIAGAGGSAHLPGMLAAITPLPVLGVPVRKHLTD